MTPADDVRVAKDFGWFCSLKEVNGIRCWQLTWLPRTAVEPQQQTSTTRRSAVSRALALGQEAGLTGFALDKLGELLVQIPATESVFNVDKQQLQTASWHIEDES